jgi:hypothetical protein
MRRAESAEAAPVAMARESRAVPLSSVATRPAPAQAVAPMTAPMTAALADVPDAALMGTVGLNAATAPSGVEIPENVVPLVWKQNLRGREWSPAMSSRWQRVLRRDRLDVPSFLRRRQVD